jgi:DNA-binding GntR family transcriptional regulator
MSLAAGGKQHMEHKRMLIEEAYQKIKDLIFEQKLAPGQKLIYNDLSRAFDMSPTPVINALYRLEHEGFVVSMPFKGFYVKNIDMQEAWDLFGVREALETYMVEQAILIAGPVDLAQLEEKFQAHAAYHPSVYDRQRFLLDSEFHLQLAGISKNRQLVRLLAMTFEHFYIRFRFDSMELDRLQTSVAEHRQIIDRIRNKDMQGGREAIHLHIQNARDHIIHCLSNNHDQRRRM